MRKSTTLIICLFGTQSFLTLQRNIRRYGNDPLGVKKASSFFFIFFILFLKMTLLWTRLYWSQTILLYQPRKLAVALICTQYERMFVLLRGLMTGNDRGGGGGGGGVVGLTVARPSAPPGGNSNRVEFPSEDINYSFTSETRWRKQKGPITTIAECNEEIFFSKYLPWK